MRNIARLAFILVASAAVSLGQEGAASRPEAVKLPVTSFVQPFENQDAIVVTISRAPMQEDTSRRASGFQAWQIGISGRTFSFDRAGMDLFLEKLRALAGVRQGTTKSAPSERTLLIKADAQAPYGLTQKVLESAAAAMIYKVSIAATDAAGGKAGAFDSWLPRDVGPESKRAKPEPVVVDVEEDKAGAPLVPNDEIRVLMSWNTQQNKLERLFGQRLIPPTAEGSDELEKLITASRDGFAKRGNPDVPLIIDAGPRVPWQNVVEVMDMAKRAGVKKIEFGLGLPLEK
jgi:biopolymer transport protein ExbD